MPQAGQGKGAPGDVAADLGISGRMAVDQPLGTGRRALHRRGGDILWHEHLPGEHERRIQHLLGVTFQAFSSGAMNRATVRTRSARASFSLPKVSSRAPSDR